jgi:4-hydroxy-3-methylbut-2-enyl diphosphate reductase
VLIGHAGHPEVVGTLGQLPEDAIRLVQTVEEAETFQPRDESKLAYVTQTTQSLDDTAGIVAVLKRRFPTSWRRTTEDICYATTNRQEAVQARGATVDALVVVGAPNSSNSKRLQEVAERAGCRYSVLVQRATEIDWSKFDGIKDVGVTAGALGARGAGRGILDALRGALQARHRTVSGADESGMFFPLPRQLRDTAAA